MRDIVEEIHIHFTIGCKVVISFKIDLTPKDHKDSFRRILNARQLQNLLEIHMNCP